MPGAVVPLISGCHALLTKRNRVKETTWPNQMR